ncbi:hypothetical protein KAI92_00510 [Candidatus Parcubacteria bacterium]|nr:hypothetical protein [Candidatus Parcubacteria bacterium]
MNKELKLLGLTNNEIIVYNTLLEIGENTVGPIIAKTKMHRQVAYDALAGLEMRNMIIKSTKNSRNNFRVANPDNILDNLKYQEKVARKVAKEVKAKLKGQKKGQEIRIYEGEKPYRELLVKVDENMPDNGEILVLAGSVVSEWMNVMKTSKSLEKIDKIRKRKNIKIRILYDESLREEVENISRPIFEYRFISQNQASPVTFEVYTSFVILSSFGSEVFAIEIKNKDFQVAYKNYFEMLWKNAKE